MSTTPVTRNTGFGVVVGCVGLALVSAYMWVLFARTFAGSMATNCGEDCTTTTDPGVDLGIFLGLAVASTVFSAALLVVALLRRSH